MAERKDRSQSPESSGQLRREETKFPTDPQERLGALLASFNIGPKATTFLLLPENGYISPEDLGKSFREAVVSTGMAETDWSTASSYCHQSLCPIGLVAKEYSIDYFGVEKLVGFGKTADGQWYGTAAAALILDFELRHKKSLFPIFGSTNTPLPGGHRAPLTRARILELLFAKNTVVRQADIVQKLTIPQPLLGRSLAVLKTAGAIDYEAVTPHTGITTVSYTLGNLSQERIRPFKSSVTLTTDVASICQLLAVDNVLITQAAVFDRIPQELKNRWKQKVLRESISNILSHLTSQGLLVRGQFKIKEIQSVAQISDWGREIVTEFLRPLWGLVNGDDQIGRRLSREIIPLVKASFDLYAQNSAELYYLFSKSFRRKHRSEHLERVKEYLANGQLTITDLGELLGLPRKTIRNYLAVLTGAGEIKRQRVKGADYYTLA